MFYLIMLYFLPHLILIPSYFSPIFMLFNLLLHEDSTPNNGINYLTKEGSSLQHLCTCAVVAIYMDDQF